MKNKIYVLLLILTISLTSCSSSDNVDVNEFIDRYNSVSETSILKENITVTEMNQNTLHHILINKNIIVTLKTDSNCEINECSITSSDRNSIMIFDNVCTYSLISLTGCNELNADKAINEAFDTSNTFGDYEIYNHSDNIQMTVIIRQLTDNYNLNPTLKEHIKYSTDNIND